MQRDFCQIDRFKETETEPLEVFQEALRELIVQPYAPVQYKCLFSINENRLIVNRRPRVDAAPGDSASSKR